MGEVRAGVGVVIKNSEGRVLVGRRITEHAPYYSIPGGHLEEGESFEECGIREICEETGIIIDPENINVIGITNDLETFRESGRHYISVILYTESFTGEPELKEPDKCEGWIWADPGNLPQPHFEASRKGIACMLEGLFYDSGQRNSP